MIDDGGISGKIMDESKENKSGGSGGSFIPAMRFHVLTPLFDFICRISGLGAGFRSRVSEVLDPLLSRRKSIRVLDAGCGTGSLAVELLGRHPSISLIGVDADPRALSIMARKAASREVRIGSVHAFLEDLPFPDGHFDVIYSVLVFHHLKSSAKLRAAKEIRRVLRKRGVFVLADMGRPFSLWGYVVSLFAVLCEEGYDNFRGKIPLILMRAGFSRVKKRAALRGNIEVWAAER